MSSIDTFGWHTVAAVTYAEINRAIAASGATPKSFSASSADQAVSVSNVGFGAWTLAFGGSGGDISMQIATTGGTVTGPFGSGGAVVTLPLAASSFPILVKAQYVPHTSAETLNLVLDHQQAVGVGAYSGAAPTPNALANAALRSLLQQWLNENIRDFNMVFASVDLDAKYVDAGLAWLTPSFRGYAVSEPPSGPTMDNCVFAVLCLVDGELPPSNIAYAVSPYAIPSGAKAAFLISGQKFLEHMMFAAMPAMFANVPAGKSGDYFKISDNGFQITNAKALTFNDLKLENGNTVSPNIDPLNFVIQLDGKDLLMSVSDMSFGYTSGVTAHLNYTCRANVSLDDKKRLALTVATQTGSGSIEVGKGLQIAEYITGGLSLLAALLGGIGGIYSAPATAIADGTVVTLTRGATIGQDIEMVEIGAQQAANFTINGVVAPVQRFSSFWLLTSKIALTVGFVGGLMPTITEIIKAVADGKYDSMPEITLLTDAAVGQTVIWPTAIGGYSLASAELNGALQFGLQ